MPPSERPADAPPGAGGVLSIDLDAIAANWRLLAERLSHESGAECAAVVKADAYGLGMDWVAPVLWRAGCRTFFVALAGEGAALRELLPDAAIHCFNGVDAGDAAFMAEHGLAPVLNHRGQIEAWADEARRRGRTLPAMLHVDTGMNRLGLSQSGLDALIDAGGCPDGLRCDGVMSHLACAEEPAHPLNAEQRRRFAAAFEALAGVGVRRASLANSSGIFLGADYQFDLARPGAALYGVDPCPVRPNPMSQVVHLQGKILQVRGIDTPSTVGYGATHQASRGRRIATVGVGYADGFLRSLSNSASATIGGVPVPLVGRVSMDLITFDVTDIAESRCRPGDYVDLIGPDHGLDRLAAEAGTIGYEILTALGKRYTRTYTGGAG